MRLTQKQFNQLFGQSESAASSKYHNEPVVVDGIRFDSVLEAKYYAHLNLLVKAGEVSHFLRQVPFDLPGGVKYRLDFLVFYAGGEVDYVDTKGAITDIFRMKKKQVESLYPVKIRCLQHKAGRFTEVKI